MDTKDQLELIRIVADNLTPEQKKGLDKEDMYGNTPLTHWLLHGMVDCAKEILNWEIFNRDRVEKWYPQESHTEEGILKENMNI